MAPKKSELNLDQLAFEEERRAKRKLLEPRILSVVSALGGFEDVLVQHRVSGEDGDDVEVEVQERVERVYRLGDECLGCLKDLKKFWRLDDHDDDRTVARILHTSKVLPNDLLPILKAVDGTGSRGTRTALLCSDLIAALTWPIDVAAELRESQDLEDEEAIRQAAFIDYSGLIAAQLSYKRDILRSGTLEYIFKLIVPALDKPRRDRTQKDENIISLILHVIRNLAALRDKPATASSSAAAAEEAYLQSDFVLQLQRYHIWDFLLIVAHGSISEDFRPWNMVALDILHLLFRGLDVGDLIISVPRSGPSAAGAPADPAGDRKLAALLEGEEVVKRREARSGASRHSRFGTTLSVQTGGKRFHLHQQSAITAPVEKALDARKKTTKRGRGEKIADDLAPPVELKPAAMRIMRDIAIRFLESGFNPFFASILTDIRMEREKVREADTVRLLYLLRFFFQFYLALRSYERSHPPPQGQPSHNFDLIAEMTDPQTLGFVTMRMKGAMDVKPALWTELHAGVDCLIQLLLVIDELTRTEDEEYQETAAQLQNRLYYEGETLDLIVNIMVNYKTQSLKYLDSIVHLAFVLLRMLEKFSKSKDRMYIRKKRKSKNRRKQPGAEGEEDEEEMDEEEQEVEDGTVDYDEKTFQFEQFEARFADEGVLKTLMTYLKGYEGFTDPEQMKRVVKLMHRQAVNAKQPNIFFKVSTLNVMNKILDQRKLFPRQPTFDDLAKLIDFIVKRFMKSARENPFLLVEVFFPKRSKAEWRKAIGEDRSDDEDAEGAAAKPRRMPAELEVRPGLTWSQQVGVAIGLLVDADKAHLLDYIKDALRTASAARTAIVLITDGMPEDRPVPETDEDIRVAATKGDKPSEEALAKFEDYHVDGGDEEARKARTKDGQLQLLMRLFGWESSDDPSDRTQLRWTIPRTRLHTQLDSDIRIIDQFLIDPLDHEGKSAAELVRKKRKPRARKTRADGDAEGDELDDDGDGAEGGKRRRKKRQEEVKQYKSAQFIADSDDEDDEAKDGAFFERERQLALRMASAAVEAGGETATPSRPKRAKPKRVVKKKREADGKKSKGKSKRQATSSAPSEEDEMEIDELEESSASASDSNEEEARQRTIKHSKTSASSLATSPSGAAGDEDDADHPKQRSTTPPSSASVGASLPSRKRSLSAASSIASLEASAAAAPTKAKARRIVMDSDDE